MKALIIGANGQDGYYLSKLLSEQKIEIVSTSRSGDHIRLDVGDASAVEGMISLHKPAYIFHLAANSTTRHDALFDNHAAISTGTLNVLEAVRKHSPLSKVFISGSGLQFKNEGKPIKETDAFEARDAYSVSRIHSAYAARYYRTLGLKVYVGYFFNHDSPLRTTRHLNRMIADAVLKIAAGKDEVIEIGDLNAKKEWGYAGDIVRAIWVLVQQEQIFESVLGTGLGYSIQEYIELCFKIIGKPWQMFVKVNPDFISPYKQLICDPATIHALGWLPEVSFEMLTHMMLEHEKQ